MLYTFNAFVENKIFLLLELYLVLILQGLISVLYLTQAYRVIAPLLAFTVCLITSEA